MKLLVGFQALKILRTSDFTPYVVFIAAPSVTGLNEMRNAESPGDSSAVAVSFWL